MKTKEEVEKLVEENIWLVTYVMNKYFGSGVMIHNELRDDIFQEASIGLFKAAKSFDESKGIKFSTYASKVISNWISRYFTRYIYKHYRNGIISLESNVYESYENEGELSIKDFLEIEESGYEEIAIMSAIKETSGSIKDIEKIVDLRLQGYLQREIGKKLEISQVQISRRLKRLENKLKAC